MGAISPNRQAGVVPHVFSRLEWLAQARSPPKSTQGSPSPLLFGQDLVKVSASNLEFGDLRLGKARMNARSADEFREDAVRPLTGSLIPQPIYATVSAFSGESRLHHGEARGSSGG